MARIGVQYSDIENAALTIQGLGKTPTVDRIREQLGTGSRSTIGKHLKDWHGKQAKISSTLPDELNSLVSGLWQKLHEGADKRVEEAEEKYVTQSKEQEAQSQLLKEELNQTTKDLHHSQEKLSKEISTSQNLRESLGDYEKKQIKLEASIQASKEKLEAATSENSRLHKLAANIQSNLEHYQEQTQKQLSELSLQAQSEKMKLNQELNTLRKSQSQTQAELAQHQQINTELQSKLLIEKNLVSQLERDKDSINTELQAEMRNNAVLLDRYKNSDKQNDLLQTKNERLKESLVELEKRLVIAGEYSHRLQNELTLKKEDTASLMDQIRHLKQKKTAINRPISKTRKKV